MQKNTSQSLLKSVCIRLSSEFPYFSVDFIKQLKKTHSSKIHVYCQTSTDEKFYRKVGADLYDSITTYQHLRRTGAEKIIDPQPIIEKAKKYERKLGYTINHIAVPDRGYGLGYALGGFYHPRSRFADQANYIQMLSHYVQSLEFWESEMKEKKITLCLSPLTDASYVANSLKIPCRWMARSRFKNYHYWSPNIFWENPRAQKIYFSSKNKNLKKAKLVETYYSEKSRRGRRLQESKFFPAIVAILRQLLMRSYWFLRGYKKGKEGYYLKDTIRYIYQRWSHGRQATGKYTLRLKDLEDKPFVFFPLTTEPEINLQQRSPEYFYQLSTIAALSRDLPAGVILAVKEHVSAIGRRPRNFYDQIKRFKNVVMVDFAESGIEIIKKSRAVATIVGTAGLEAIILGKPVILFGKHNSFDIVPHAKVVKDEGKLKKYLSDILNKPFDTKKAQSEGAKYLSALISSSFDFGHYDYIDYKKYDKKIIKDAHKSLIESLGS
ncbi:MAG: hypothetical protein CL506_03270 [Actinobacteria bacterium]|nr:hypothetical protein [Actinomycetota bacterium]